MKKTYIFAGALVVAAILGYIVFGSAIKTASHSPTTDSAQAPAKQTSYTFRVQSEGTVLSAMEAYAKTAAFQFSMKEFKGIGVMIESINGLSNDAGHYWILYVNGKSADKGASDLHVSAGDTVTWKFEKSY